MSKTRLTFLLLDTHRTWVAVVRENEHLPYGRRTVQIALTPEQEATIKPLGVGLRDGRKVYEELADVWIERHPQEGESDDD